MDKRTLEIILVDQQEELNERRSMRFCQRKEEDQIDLDSPQAQVVIGVRRSGKSTLCFNALTRKGVKFAYVNFDDERLVHLAGQDLNDVLEVLYKINGDFQYLFIDEIQNIPEWFLFVNRLLRRQLHVLITGSNAKLLSGELATHLTGRHNTIILYPFSFGEYCEAKNMNVSSISTKSIAARRATFDEYLRQGGFPELLTIRNQRNYISGLVDNILKRDIEQRFKVLHTATFENLANHMLNVAPAIVVDRNLQDTFGLKSSHTVKNYLSYLKQAYLLIGLQKYSPKSKIRITSEKLYPIDVALMNTRENAFSGENLGWRMETVVYLELLRRYKNDGKDIYYFADRSGECDFIVCNNQIAILAVQVSYDISSPKTKKREITGLLLTARKTGCQNLLLLTDHEYEDITVDGYDIAIRPVYDYVLGN
ncbi:MAG: ATP-binding protein [Muribaculaceae bacterium]|nr:ATP-binding protein [Muribaculaceae bacterium]